MYIASIKDSQAHVPFTLEIISEYKGLYDRYQLAALQC